VAGFLDKIFMVKRAAALSGKPIEEEPAIQHLAGRYPEIDTSKEDAKAEREEKKAEREEKKEEKREVREDATRQKEAVSQQVEDRRRARVEQKEDRNPAGLTLHDYANANIIGSTSVALAREAEREEKIGRQQQLSGDLTGAHQHLDRAS